MKKVEVLQKFNKGEYWYLLEIIGNFKNLEEFCKKIEDNGYNSITEYLEDEFEDENRELSKLVEEYFQNFVYEEIYVYTFGMGDGFRWKIGYNCNVVFCIDDNMCYIGTMFEWESED